MSFALFLLLLLVVTGLVWVLEAAWLRRHRPASNHQPWWVEYSISFFPVILIVFLLRSFVVEPFKIPSGSMIPTLLVGDFILVNKFSYGIRLPVLNRKVVPIGQPKRGDVMVFRFPEDPSLDYIKRVVGIPGDVVEYRNKTLYINGEAVDTDILEPYREPGGRPAGGMRRGVERLPGHEHEILISPGRPNSPPRERWVVGEGEYFVLGDNRDNSRDSRFWGMVPDENLVGKAFFIWMHLSPSGFNRIGTVIE